MNQIQLSISTVNLPDGIVLSSDFFKRIESLISSETSNICVFAVRCSDSVSRMFVGADELLAYKNLLSNKIQSMEIASKSDDNLESISIRLFDAPNNKNTLEVRARGDEKRARIVREVFSLIGDASKWYSVLWKVDFIGVLLIANIILFLIANAILEFKLIDLSTVKLPPKNGEPTGIIPVIAVLSVFYGSGCFMNWLRSISFPKATFLIGAESERFSELKQWQWMVITLVISAIVACIPSIIYMIFSGLLHR